MEEPFDELARFNRERWEALVEAGVVFSRPFLGMDTETARRVVDPEGILGALEGKDVLCLAGGGGQQSAAFALLGARVTVLDLTPAQLERDRAAARHYGTAVKTDEGDMRDLSRYGRESFDIVWHAHSLNFVPQGLRVLQEVGRVLRSGGHYRLSFTNPFVHGSWERWAGNGFLLAQPYIDSKQIEYEDERWDVYAEDGSARRVEGPKEFRHTMSTVVNGLIGCGMVILGLWEKDWEESQTSRVPKPGSWDHFCQVAPPFLTIWARRQPEVFCSQKR